MRETGLDIQLNLGSKKMIKINPVKKTLLINPFKYKKSSKLPVVEKPLVAYMEFKNLEPEREFLGGLKSLFDNIHEALNDRKSVSDTLKDTATKVKVETKAKVVSETKYKTEQEERYTTSDYDSLYQEPSFLQKISSAISRTVESLIMKVQDWRYDIQIARQEKREAISSAREKLRRSVIMEPLVAEALGSKAVLLITRKKKLSLQKMEKLQAKADAITEKIEKQRAVDRAKQDMLEELRKNFEKMLKRYEKSFDSDELKPDMSKFKNYKALVLTDLKDLYDKLLRDLEHQRFIKTKKNNYQKGAEYYLSEYEQKDILERSFAAIDFDYLLSNSQYKFGYLSDSFLINIENVGLAINVLKDVKRKYLDLTRVKLEEIFNPKNNNSLFAESGIPENIQFIDQHNLTNCLIKDLDDIEDKFIKNGLERNLNECNMQFLTIEKISKQKKHSPQNIDFLMNLLKKIEISLKEANEEYNKFYGNFLEIRNALSQICERLKKAPKNNI